MKNEFENIEQALNYFNELQETEFHIEEFSDIEEYAESIGKSLADKDDVSEMAEAINFFKRHPNDVVYEMSSNGSGESTFTVDAEDVYYFINDIN